jgi:GNAT superfamily N-acetyltransferase
MALEFRYLTNLRIGGDEWTNHRVEAWRGDEKLGHITIAFISRDTFEELFPTVEDYARRIKGIENPTDDDCAILYRFYRSFEEFHVETAHVAYVIVEEEHQRQGIGTQLYLEGARWIWEHHKLLLAASDLQRPEVEPLWAKLVEDPSVATVKLHDERWALNGEPTT